MQKDLEDSVLYEERYRFKERASNFRFFLVILLIALVFIGGRLYWVNHFGGVEVDGSSMNWTLRSGQQLLIRYTDEDFQAKRGDIIVVHVENYPEVQALNAGKKKGDRLEYLIKRLIAVEGDTVKCEQGQIYLKKSGETEFSPLDESYAYYDPSSGGKEGYNFGEYKVKEGEIFFLGDNRHHSLDSRYQEGDSHLKNPGRLYKQEDIFGVVPEWAVEHRETLEKIFFNSFQIKSK